MEPILIIKAFLIGWWIAYFEPLQTAITKYIRPRIKNMYISKSLSCLMCLSFWSGLVISWDFYTAVAASLLAFTYSKVIGMLYPKYTQLD